MITFTDSTVFNTNADCIVNTINCVSFMGKGLALEFALRYPELEKIYKEECNNNKIHTGCVYFYEIDGQKIINFPTKYHFKYPSKIEWIEQGLKYFVNNYKKWGIKSIAFPLLGTSNGGLNQKEVEEIMVKYLSTIDIDVYICHSKLIEGKEKEMVDNFKSLPIDELNNYVKLTEKQKDILKNNKNKIVRFSDIYMLESIGSKTYKSIFNYFYNNNKKNNFQQLRLF